MIYYDFEETSGSVLVDKAPDGTPTNADVVGLDLSTTVSVTGIFGKAYHKPYDGENFISIDNTPGNAQHDLSLPDALYFGTGPYTISAWIYLPENHTGSLLWGNTDFNAANADPPRQRDGVFFLRNNNETLGGAYADNNHNRHQWGYVTPIRGWFHLVLTGDQQANQSRMYINGRMIRDGVHVQGDVGDPNVPFTIGRNPVDPTHLSEAIYDDFAVWHRALTPDEIARIFRAGSAGYSLQDYVESEWFKVTVPYLTSQHVNAIEQQMVDVRIQNLTGSAAEIDAITVDKGAFAADTLVVDLGDVELPLTLDPGSSVTVKLVWEPTAVIGDRLFKLTVGNDPVPVQIVASVVPDTLAWWRFENGTAGQQFAGTNELSNNTIAVQDASGLGNHLYEFWGADSPQAARTHAFSDIVPPVVTGPNSLSMLYNGPGSANSTNNPPASVFTWAQGAAEKPTVALETVALKEWTIEAFVNFASNTNGHSTIVGRDGRHLGGNTEVIYFKIRDRNQFGVEYGPADGPWMDVFTERNMVPDNWYYVAAVSDGQTIKLYVADLTAGETEAKEVVSKAITGADTRFVPHPDPTPTRFAPVPRMSWAVGRGYYDSLSTDVFLGLIDEVRISSRALDIATESLMAYGVPVELDSFMVE